MISEKNQHNNQPSSSYSSSPVYENYSKPRESYQGDDQTEAVAKNEMDNTITTFKSPETPSNKMQIVSIPDEDRLVPPNFTQKIEIVFPPTEGYDEIKCKFQ